MLKAKLYLSVNLAKNIIISTYGQIEQMQSPLYKVQPQDFVNLLSDRIVLTDSDKSIRRHPIPQTCDSIEIEVLLEVSLASNML